VQLQTGVPAARRAQTAVPAAMPAQTAVPAAAIARPPGAPPPVARQTEGLREMFREGNSLLRAVIAAEVLGPPRALQESVYWRASRANEPSNSPD